jgi:hypothetical protein
MGGKQGSPQPLDPGFLKQFLSPLWRNCAEAISCASQLPSDSSYTVCVVSKIYGPQDRFVKA